MTPEEIRIEKALDAYYLEGLEHQRETEDLTSAVEHAERTGSPLKVSNIVVHPVANENALIGYIDRKYKKISPTDRKAIHKKYLSDKGPQCPGCLVYTWEHHHDKACALSASRTA